MKSILVKNIPKEVSTREFYEFSKKFGQIKKCKLVLDYYGESKGYGYVSYYGDNESAKNEFNVKLIYILEIRL